MSDGEACFDLDVGSGEGEAGFDPVWYAAEYPDVAILGMDPAQHFKWIGRKLGRRGSPQLSMDNAQGNGAVRIAPPRITGEGSPVSLLIDDDWYRDKYLGQDYDKTPREHYEEVGARLGYDPNPYFDVGWYLTKYPDVAAAGVNPVEHYFRFGAAEGRNPSPRFDTRFYAMQVTGSREISGDLLSHYIREGQFEGNIPHPNAIRAEVCQDSLGSGTAIRPISVRIGVVAYKQDVSEIISLIESIDKAVISCGPNVSSSITVIDNGLTIPGNLLPPHVVLTRSTGNVGFGRAHNAIMQHGFTTGSEVYIGVNPDGAMHHDCLKNMLRMNQRHRGNALIEALQFPEEHPKFYHPETLECAWISGACFLISKSIWQATGGFDEKIFLYCEDVDLSWSARQRGYKLLTCPTALFFHDVSDRQYSHNTWREMLISGRYLAHKWRNNTFRETMEREILAAGFFKSVADMPKLSSGDVVDGDISHTNFDKMFSFTSTRW